MSFKTWKDEFYSISASEVDEEYALEHSIRKWEGLLEENLSKHKVVIYNGGSGCKYVIDETLATHPDISAIVRSAGFEEKLKIDGYSCSLCEAYQYEEYDGYPCEKCPLAQSRGDIPCDCENDYEVDNRILAPWQTFIRELDPKPMLKALYSTREYLESKNN